MDFLHKMLYVYNHIKTCPSGRSYHLNSHEVFIAQFPTLGLMFLMAKVRSILRILCIWDFMHDLCATDDKLSTNNLDNDLVLCKKCQDYGKETRLMSLVLSCLL